MTGRELLNQLQAFSEKTLGEVVVVSPPSGGYGMIETPVDSVRRPRCHSFRRRFKDAAS
jgi:hypothetical protein